MCVVEDSLRALVLQTTSPVLILRIPLSYETVGIHLYGGFLLRSCTRRAGRI